MYVQYTKKDENLTRFKPQRNQKKYAPIFLFFKFIVHKFESGNREGNVEKYFIRKFICEEALDLKKIILKCVSNCQEIINKHKGLDLVFNPGRY